MQSLAMAVSDRVEAVLKGESWDLEGNTERESPEPQQPVEMVESVTEYALDSRLVGTWKACDPTVDRITIEKDGSFVNRLYSSDTYPDGIRGRVRAQLWNDATLSRRQPLDAPDWFTSQLNLGSELHSPLVLKMR